MRQRAPLILTLLAVGVVCLLLWDAVIAPALDGEEGEESASILDEAALLEGGGENAAGPTLSTKGRAPGVADGEFARGPDGGGLTPEEAAALRAGPCLSSRPRARRMPAPRPA